MRFIELRGEQPWLGGLETEEPEGGSSLPDRCPVSLRAQRDGELPGRLSVPPLPASDTLLSTGDG